MRSNAFASKQGFAVAPTSLGAVTALELVESKDFAAAATSYTFSGLDGDADGDYLVEFRIVNAFAGAATITVRPNGATTNQLSKGTFFGTGSGTFSTSDLYISNATVVDAVGTGSYVISAASGKRRTLRGNVTNSESSTDLYGRDVAGMWDETATNITSLEFVCDQTDGIDTGSYIRLYRIRKD